MTLKFENRYAKLGERFSFAIDADPLSNPKAVIINVALLKPLGLDNYTQDDLLSLFSGHQTPKDASPLAMVYAGHQFGGYSPQLGDGRGVLIGQVRDSENKLVDLHLKGAGKTPFSRMGDGRAVLRSCIREFLASEALFHLGIPTTRALAITTGDEQVRRETIENAAMLMRASDSHIRFGSFEYFSYTDQHTELKQLCDYTIETHFPKLKNSDKPYDELLLAVSEKTGNLIAHWQAFGFAHGVMNTDNMSIIGQTFDYGPYGFMENYDPYYICNHSDDQGRYAFNRQQEMGRWNCQALSQALAPLTTPGLLEKALNCYEETFLSFYHGLMTKKLGFSNSYPEDKALYEDLLDLLEGYSIDYTIFFRSLSRYYVGKGFCTLLDNQNYAASFAPWFERYNKRLQIDMLSETDRHEQMCAINPKFILRNYLAHKAIKASEDGDHSELHRLYDVLKDPYGEQSDQEQYAQETPDWGRNLQVSCSS